MWRERAATCGERIAAEFLVLRGMDVVDRNVRMGRGEIDLVARDRDQVVFVEVKFRTAGGMATPFDAVGAKKREDVAKAAALYLARRGLLDRPVRFDVVGITWRADDGELLVQHVPNAYPGGRRQFF
ncbi:MAG TPA: YraN family protein [Candidatus Saccharimonadales bacterium]|nr:YraN family protein [Candidatus Saccharimonadales bacterium]